MHHIGDSNFWEMIEEFEKPSYQVLSFEAFNFFVCVLARYEVFG